MTKPSNRTKPLDRDGDGHNGGSLPGNKTAPMTPPAWIRDDARLLAKLQIIQATLDPALTDAALADEVDGWTDAEAEAVEGFAEAMAAPGRYQDEQGDERNADGSAIDLPPVLGRFLIGEEQAEAEPAEIDDLADTRTTPGDSPEKLEAIEREVDQANDAEWARAADGIKRLVQLRMDAEKADTGEETARLQAEADALAAELGLSEGEALLAVELSGGDAPDTFTPEEVAAAAQVNEAEGEAPAVAAEPTVIPTDDPLVQIETETAPIAVRERELRLLLDSRRLYKSPMPSGDWGYSSNYGAPYVDEATVQAWITAGLAEDVPSAGNHGGVKPTHEARRQLGLIRHGEAA